MNYVPVAELQTIHASDSTQPQLRVLLGELSAVLAGGHPVDGFAGQLEELAAGAIGERDVEAIAGLREQVRRLAARMRSSRSSDLAVTARLSTSFGVLDHMLEVGQTVALVQNAADRRGAALPVLRERFLEALRSGDRRPRDLSAEFSCDPAQASRILRELVESGNAIRVPAKDADRRSHWYGLAAAHGAAAS